jgi:hypothetical protein
MPALLAMTAISAGIAVAWLLTVDFWCDATGLRKAAGSPARAELAASRPLPESAASRRAARRSSSRPAARRVDVVSLRYEEGVAGYVVGRVVTHSGPVRLANVRLMLVDQDGAAWHQGDAADEEGRFALAIPEGTFASATFEAESPRHSGLRTVNVPPPFSGTKNIGDFALSGFRTIWFSILSPAGDPIENAVVKAAAGKSRTEHTGPDGIGSIDVIGDVQTLLVSAFGCEPAEVPIPPGDDSVTVRMKSSTTLFVHVTTNCGDPNPARVMIVLEAEGTACEVASGDPAWKALGNTRPDWSSLQQTSFSNTNDVRLCRVRAGVDLTVEAREIGTSAATRQIVRLERGQHRRLELVLPGDYRKLCGRIVDASGNPIKGAMVRRGSPVGGSYKTGEDGAFNFGTSLEKSAALSVSVAGFAFWKATVPLPTEEAPLLITLDRGEAVTVTVVDLEGSSVPGAWVTALDRHGPTDASGNVTLRNLPRSAFTVQAVSAGTASAERAPGSSAVTVRVASR